VRLASVLCRGVPSLEKVRLVSSGTEATMSAIRVARGYTGRHKIVKFEGNYHGHADFCLQKPVRGWRHWAAGVRGRPPAVTADTLTLPYNDIEACRRYFWRKERRSPV